MAEQLDVSELPVSVAKAEQPAKRPLIAKFDNFLEPEMHKQVYEFVRQPGWRFGWKSDENFDRYAFWHKHFAGAVYPDTRPMGGAERQYDCADELKSSAPLLHAFWCALEQATLAGHTLVRCYANGHPYGSEGTLHLDSQTEGTFTSIYYPHDKWSPNWGGETVFFNKERTDILAAVYPKPNRFLTFDGTIYHVARGVSRVCPVLRITLMFKTQRRRD
jgi:SM-20-related protein